MRDEQVLALLTEASLIDYRVDPSAPAALVWHSIIGDLDYPDAQAAVRAHYAASTERVLPAHVLDGVRAIRHGRIEAAGPPGAWLADIDPDADDYVQRRAARTEAIASGRWTPGQNPPALPPRAAP